MVRRIVFELARAVMHDLQKGVDDGIAWALTYAILPPLPRRRRVWSEMPTVAIPRAPESKWEDVCARTAARGVRFRVQSQIEGDDVWCDATAPYLSYEEADDVVVVLERNRAPEDRIRYRVTAVLVDPFLTKVLEHEAKDLDGERDARGPSAGGGH